MISVRTHILFALLLLGFSGFFFFPSFAASSQVLLTWEAENYVPALYPGRHLVTPGSSVSISAELLSGGKLQDARQATFTWYVDGDRFLKGVGKKEISFSAKKGYGNSYSVRVVIQSGENEFEAASQILISRPELVLAHPYTSGVLRAGGEASFRALPYFFSVSSSRDVQVSWSVNDERKATLGGNETFLLTPGAFRGKFSVAASAKGGGATVERRVNLFVP
ncbi:MAG: hypothetical protein Q8P01_05280 [bacterium]|nr:hypothetical protein [bacterium]